MADPPQDRPTFGLERSIWEALVTGRRDCPPQTVVRALEKGLDLALKRASEDVIGSLLGEEFASNGGAPAARTPANVAPADDPSASPAVTADAGSSNEGDRPRAEKVMRHVRAVLDQLSSDKVMWVPEFGCAIVLQEHDDLCDHVFLQFFALDGFAYKTPMPAAETPGGLVSASTESTQLRVEVLQAWRKDAPTTQGMTLGTFYSRHVSRLIDRTGEQVMQEHVTHRPRQKGKRHHTPGYFLGVVKVALAVMEVPENMRAEAYRSMIGDSLTAGRQLGGYRDVGQHTGCVKPCIGRTLVQETFRYLLRQRIEQCKGQADHQSYIVPTTPAQLLVLFDAVLVFILGSFEVDNRLGFRVDAQNAIVLACKQAASGLAALHHSIATAPAASKLHAFAKHVADRLEEYEAEQRKICAAAVLENLQAASYTAQAGEEEDFGPFTVKLPAAAAQAADAAAAALDGHGGFLNTLERLPGENSRVTAAQLVLWLSADDQLAASGTVCGSHVRLMTVEQWFVHRALDAFACPTPLCQAADIDQLLEIYCGDVKTFIAKTQSLRVKPCLLVELASRRVLMTWIAMCMTHRLAKAQWVDLMQYALPVDEADLRHLVLSDAHDALSCVAAYVRDVREGAQKGALFHTHDFAPTRHMILSYTRDYSHKPAKELRDLLKRNEEIAQERVEAHWRAVQAKQEKVRGLQVQLAAAKQALAAAAAKVQEQRRVLDGLAQGDESRTEHRRLLCSLQAAEQSCQARVDALLFSIAAESRPPEPLIQALPKDDEGALVVLFFLYKAHAGALPDLARLCFAAQHLLRAHASGKEPTLSATFIWQEYFNAQHRGKYAPHPEAHCPAVDAWDVALRSSEKPPIASEIPAPIDVMHFRLKGEDGVWYPSNLPPALGWQGGASLSRVAVATSKCLDPFAPRAATDSSESWKFNEAGLELDSWWWRPSVPGKDVGESWDLVRGHRSRQLMDQKPQGYTTEQWDAFAALRSYPYRQLSRLCAVLRDQTLPLDDTEGMWPCVRMVLHHVGQFVLHATARPAKRMQRLWPDAPEEIATLRSELRFRIATLHDAPREAFQVPLLCEIAAIIDAQREIGSRPVCMELANMAAHWAETLLEPELSAQTERGASREQTATMRTAAARAHMLVVLAFGARLQQTSLSSRDAALLLRHAALAQQRHLSDVSSEHHHFMDALWRQTTRVLCAHATSVDAQKHADALRTAAAAVFSDAADARDWSPCTDALGCFASAPIASGVVFSMCVLTGEVLRNGRAAARLHDAVLQAASYKRTFGDRNFDVDSDLWTAQTVLGRRYKFVPLSSAHRPLIILEAEPRSDGSECVLELLPEDCAWCPRLRPRLKTPYSHWRSQKYGTIVLRGVTFDKRTPEYLMIPSSDDVYRLYRVPEYLQGLHWMELKGMLDEMDELLDFEASQSATIRVLMRIERPTCIHVFRPAASEHGSERGAWLFELPRLRLSLQLSTDGCLVSKEYNGYQIAGPSTAVTSTDPILPPSFTNCIVLTSNDPLAPTKVLIPGGVGDHVLVGAGTDFVRIASPEQADLNDLRSHVFDLEPRTQTLRPQSLEGALLLTAIYAAACCDVRLPELKCTPGEHAMTLLRQSWTNEPLSAREAARLREVVATALHTPALYLLCERLKRDADSISFLYPSSRRDTNAAARQSLQQQFEHRLKLASAAGECSAGELAFAGLPFSHARRRLTPVELRDIGVPGVCSSAHMPPMQIRSEDRVCWEIMHEARNMTSTLQEYVAYLVGEPLGLLLKHRSEHRQQHATQQAAHIAADVARIVDTPSLRKNKVGQGIVQDSRKSLDAFREQPDAMIVAEAYVTALHKNLQGTRDKVRFAQQAFFKHLHNMLGRQPATMQGHIFRALRSGNAVAMPTAADLVRITIAPGHMETLNPFLDDHCRQQVHQHAAWWQQLCVLEDKLERCVRRCELLQKRETAAIDSSLEALSLELANKRVWSVDEHPRWLAFEVLQGLEIREQQYFVAQHLLEVKGDEGRVLQLNMGEGKTRVILPMLVLALAGSGAVPRLTFLHELLTDGVQYLRRCLTGSLLQVKLYLLPFTRDVELSDGNVGDILSTLRRCMKDGGFVCVSREHRLSLLLKTQEQVQRHGASARLTALQDQLGHVRDFLDESDELLVHTFQLIYTYGLQMDLPSGHVRWEVVQALLCCIARDPGLRKYLKSKPDIFRFRDHPEPGRMPELRFVPGDALEKAMPELHRRLLRALQSLPRASPLSWIKHVANQDALLDCCMHCKDFAAAAARLGVPDAALEPGQQLLVLRGLLFHGILQHCLCNRLFVDFGFTAKSLQRSMLAVPFRHCDVPSERADFKHPEVTLVYTHISYYHVGLSDDQVLEVFEKLQKLGPNQQKDNWRTFYDHGVTSAGAASPARAGEYESVDAIEKIDLDNGDQVELLRKLWRHNMRVINYWLAHCMLKQATKQFPESMRATAWHLTTPAKDQQNGRAVCGFSGTNDNQLLLPLDVSFKHPEGGATLATNGKMLTLLLQRDTCSFVSLRDATKYQDRLEHNGGLPAPANGTSDARVEVHVTNRKRDARDDMQPDAWKRLLRVVVDTHAAALIDAGALLAGVELEDAARYLAGILSEQRTKQGGVAAAAQAKDRPADRLVYQGVVFFSDEWQVMDLRGTVRSKRTSPVQEADAIVIFDDARCRGADMKLRPDAQALLTLGPGMLRSKLMQAAGRLRQLDKGQGIKLIASDEVCTSVRARCGLESASPIEPRHVLQWTLQNTAAFIERGLLEFSRQGLRYAQFLDTGSVVETDSCDLAGMYEATRTTGSIADAFDRESQRYELNGAKGGVLQAQLKSYMEEYGADVVRLLGSADEECEREVEEEEEAEMEAEVEVQPPRVTAREERSWQPSWEGGLHCENVEAFKAASITKVNTLKDTVTRMTSEHEGKHLLSINWPPHVYTTDNFTFVDKDLVIGLASVMPFPTALLCFRDGSALVLSEREADQCDAVLRRCRNASASGREVFEVRAWLLTLSYARNVLAETRHRRRRHERANGEQSAAAGSQAFELWNATGLVKGPRTITLDRGALEKIAQAIAAVQLFAGETIYEDEAVLRSLVIPPVPENTRVGAKRTLEGQSQQRSSVETERCKLACVELVSLRDRSEHWEGSTLDKMFRDEQDRAVSAAAS